MLNTAEQTGKFLLDLLSDWGEALLSLQADMPGHPELDGGILCPSCKMIHGRCHEAVYPFLTLARFTGRREYVTAAVKVFDWGANMLRPDGSMKNDEKSDWRGTTVFGAAALRDALFYHGDLLPADEKAKWEERLARMGDWLYKNLRPDGVRAYINYYAANACVTALLGKYFRKEEYLRRSRELAEFCLSHTGESGLLYGEGHPIDVRTGKGCRAVDAGGYNVEETLPMLTRCAMTLGDGKMLDSCRELWRAHLRFMLPDGAWDDSAGSRAFKWTYWGSRTSDGCQEALFALRRTEPVFAEAALRNAGLYARCTRGGLLYGGPDLHENGEKPCVHHTFCHAKAIAGALNGGLYDFERTRLPSETAEPVIRIPELDLVRISYGGWIADVSGYDHSAMPGGHASGGTVSLLWHKKTGPLIACGAADPIIKEPLNQQFPSDDSLYRRACPRFECTVDGARFAQYYDLKAKTCRRETPEGVTVIAEACLRDKEGNSLPDGAVRLTYDFTEDKLRVRGGADPAIAENVFFILPLIGTKAEVYVKQGEQHGAPERFSNVNPGFAGYEYRIGPDKSGTLEAVISV